MKLLVLHEKHAERYYHYTTTEQLWHLALQIVIRRHEDGDYEGCMDAREEKQLATILRTQDARKAWQFLQHRGTWEYEGYALEETENDDSELS